MHLEKFFLGAITSMKNFMNAGLVLKKIIKKNVFFKCYEDSM